MAVLGVEVDLLELERMLVLDHCKTKVHTKDILNQSSTDNTVGTKLCTSHDNTLQKHSS